MRTPDEMNTAIVNPSAGLDDVLVHATGREIVEMALDTDPSLLKQAIRALAEEGRDASMRLSMSMTATLSPAHVIMVARELDAIPPYLAKELEAIHQKIGLPPTPST